MNATLAVQTMTGATIRRNVSKGGLEIAFPARPAPDVLEALKAEGWRWSRMARCWWTRYSDHAARRAFALLGLPAPVDLPAFEAAVLREARSVERSWDEDPTLLGGTCVR